MTKLDDMMCEATLIELLADKKSKLYFHGASNDKGQDPDNRKIEPPSPEHPFFVTDDVEMAKMYSEYETGKDGRISERKVNQSLRRVYVLRLSDKARFFDYTVRQNSLRLFKHVGLNEKMSESLFELLNNSGTFMGFAENLGEYYGRFGSSLEKMFGNVDRLDDDAVLKFRHEHIHSKDGNYTDRFLVSHGAGKSIDAMVLLWPHFRRNFLNGDFPSWPSKVGEAIKGRRAVKAMFFRHVLEMGYNVFVERDTITVSSSREYGVLDIAAIKDVCPAPISIKMLERTMKSLKDHNFPEYSGNYLLGDSIKNEVMNEAGLVISKRSGAYPKDNCILIMAGGAGSGKSFILDKLLLFDGKEFNPDITLQEMIDIGKRNPSWPMAMKFKDEYGFELKDVDLKNNDDCSKIYDFLDKTRLHCKREAVFFKSVQNVKNKPNVIFDVTLKNLKALEFIGLYAKLGNYDPKNIHLVWVMNDVAVALDQNAKRNRSIDPNYVKMSNEGAAITFKTLIDYSDKFQDIVDGDIWIVFNNQKENDVKTKVSFKKKDEISDEYVANINIDPNADSPYVAIHMKDAGMKARTWSEIEKPMLDKLSRYSKLKFNNR